MVRPRGSVWIAPTLVSLLVAAAAARGEPGPHPADLDRNGVLILVRSSLLALDDANKSGNYTVLRDLGSARFASANTAARLGELFAEQRRDHIDLSGVAVLDPQLSLLPQIEPNGLLHMKGFFPSVPSKVEFELLYEPVQGTWKLFGISVRVGPSGPVAPEPPAVVSTAPRDKKVQEAAHRPLHKARPASAAIHETTQPEPKSP